ncbi:MAG TPA: peptidoglycan-associated lipoprotein Pal [Albitalea sp.]|nr:peptidoglycan-associated lipoprotein Pal [Albitalea sp.]
MNSIKSLALTMFAAAALAACSNTPVTPDASSTKPAASAGTTAAQPTANSTPAPASKVASVVLPQHKDPNSALSKERSVYFDFDDFSIKSQYTGVIERHGKYAQGNPKLAIRIEGSADERGSAEYNLALGQRRAESVLHALEIYGVKVSQMEPVSFGEERPKAAGHDEAAWAQNRRADIAYQN